MSMELTPKCVEDGRDHSEACITCEDKGYTAEECGPKTRPRGTEPKAPLAETHTSPDITINERFCSIEKDMADIKSLILTIR